jgi:plasmid stabilization system protein ParE
MTYHVELADRAVRDLDALYQEKNVAGSEAAARWYNGLEGAILSLTKRPHRCPKAPEARNSKRDLRHLLYGKKPHVYRVIYEIDERRQTIWILTIRHGVRRNVQKDGLT